MHGKRCVFPANQRAYPRFHLRPGYVDTVSDLFLLIAGIKILLQPAVNREDGKAGHIAPHKIESVECAAEQEFIHEVTDLFNLQCYHPSGNLLRR